MSDSKKTMPIIIGVIVLVVLAVVGYGMATAPDNRSFGEKAGDAVGALDEGVDDAAREFEDRTPLERAGDEIEDATDGSPE